MSRDEAAAYLADPVLGSRLIECARILTELSGPTARDIFGGVDAIKLRSSMTLFARTSPETPLFQQVLDQCFGGHADDATDRLLARRGAEKSE